MTQSQTTEPKPRWRRLATLLLLLAVVATFVAWLVLKNVALARIEKELAQLGLGEPVVGNVSISANGISANDVSFARVGQSDPWLSFQSLAIEHPLARLAAGDDFFDGLTIEGLRTEVDLANVESDQPFDLSSFDFPAKRINLSNATVIIWQSKASGNIEPRNEIVIDKINGTVKDTKQGFVVNGEIGDLIGSNWTVAGEATASKDQWSVKISSDHLTLVDGQWQSFPGLPEGLADYFRATVEIDAEVMLRSSLTGEITYTVEANLNEGKLNLPKFNLPIDIRGGKVTLEDNLIQYTDMVASTDGIDALNGSGSTSISGFPIQSTFEVDFTDLDIASLRKFATAIPIEVNGKASGFASGSVNIEDTLRTTIIVNANGDSSTARYGSIVAKSSNVDVKITPLIFDSQQNFEFLDGAVTVLADAERVWATEVFRSLNLNFLQRQLEIEANANGELRLKLPLSTVSKIETWEMNVSATAQEAKLAQQPVRDVRLEANLSNGNLNFNEIVAVPVSQMPNTVAGEAFSESNASSVLRATVQWPLKSIQSPSDLAKLNFQGQNVPTDWLAALINRQAQNATGMTDKTFEQNVKLLAGKTTFDTAVSLNANAPEDIQRWSVDGTIRESTLIAAGQQLRDLEATLGLRQGVFSFSKLQGSFEGGGTIDAQGQFSLLNSIFDSAKLAATDVPLRWIAQVAAEVMPAVGEQLEATGLLKTKPEDQLDGELSVEFELLPPTKPNSWSVFTEISSKRLTVKGEELSDVSLSGKFDANSLAIDSARAAIGNRGQLDLSGNWNRTTETGNADLAWKHLPIKWLASFTNNSNNTLGGATSGSVNVSNNINRDSPVPYSIEGSVRAEGLEFAGLKSRELGFEIRNVRDELLLDRFRTDSNAKEVDLVGKVKLSQPYEYEIDGTIEQLALTKLFARPSVTEAVKSTAVTGNANGKFDLRGNLEQMQVDSSGGIELSELTFDGSPLSDISATWNYSGSDWKKSSLSLDALGGKVKMTELTPQPQRIKVELTDVDARELTTLAKLTTKLTGTLSGDASFNEWDVDATRWAELNLRGASILAGNVELGDFSSSLKYRNKTLEYSAEGRILNGKIVAEGNTAITESIMKTELPLKLQFTNGSLSRLHRIIGNLGPLRDLQGSLAANAELKLRLDQMPSGTGSLKLSNLTYNGELVTRQISTNVNLEDGNLNLENLRADLKRGEISGKASIPIKTNSRGTYELNVRSFDLQRFLEIAMKNPIDGVGLVDTRITGRIGQTISGQGSVSVNRADVLGLSGRTLRLPVQFQYIPSQQTAKIEFRRSRFQIFNGKVAGKASLELGKSNSLEADLNVSNLDTDDLLYSLAGLRNSGQGKLSGRLKLNGNYIHSVRDLKGSFRGNLDRADAFQFPLLDSFSRFLGGNRLQSRDFEAQDIDLRLSRGRIEVRSLNISNAIAQVAFSGNAYLDGRLDLDVAARIDRVNQPTLIDQFLGSPLSRLNGSPVALFAQAAELLSDRLVLVQIGGTFSRPILRLDAGKQLQEETIRYFLRGSQILPNRDDPNN